LATGAGVGHGDAAVHAEGVAAGEGLGVDLVVLPPAGPWVAGRGEVLALVHLEPDRLLGTVTEELDPPGQGRRQVEPVGRPDRAPVVHPRRPVRRCGAHRPPSCRSWARTRRATGR